MNESRLTYLFKAYFAKTASPQERDELMELLILPENDEEAKNLLSQAWELTGHEPVFTGQQVEGILGAILEKEKTIHPARAPFYRRAILIRIATAAAILLLVFSGTYFLLKSKPIIHDKHVAKISKQTQDAIVPGGNKALLILSNGTRIVLDSTNQGILASQGDAHVINSKTALAYNAELKKTGQVVYNTLSTPNGGQYQLILSDSTLVWLNAFSSITFPTVFNGNERKVTVTGEAYFEVAKDHTKPFTIDVKDEQVQVLGTHFNIMAYQDENSTNTTLLEGSVKVIRGSSQKILHPGQQSSVKENGEIKVAYADVEEVMAWKNGWFQFNAYDIEKIMRQISRWYNVEVLYEGAISTSHFTGMVSRENNIAQVLKIMEAGGVHFKIEGRKVTVY